MRAISSLKVGHELARFAFIVDQQVVIDAMWLQWCNSNMERESEHARADEATSVNVELQEELQYESDGELDRYGSMSE